MALIDPPLYLQADAHPARTFRAVITETWDEGVLRLTNFKVTQKAGGADFSVDVAAGRAVIKGDSATLQGNYMATNDATVNDASTQVTSAPSAGNHRKDLVILEIKDNAEDAGGLNLARIRVLAGTPVAVASTPVVPTLPVSAIALAEIGPITNSTTSITTSIITDVRTLAGRVCTPGTIEHLAGTHVPNGWLECAGQTVSRTTYADLFAEIGTQYNTGGEAGTDFRLPVGRGRVFVPALSGQSQVDTIGETGGAYTKALSKANLPTHVHANDHNHASFSQSIGTYSIASLTVDAGDGSSSTFAAGPTVSSISIDVPNYTGNTGNGAADGLSGTAVDIMNPYQVVGLAVIRT